MAVTLTEDMIKGAKETEKKYGVPTSITLGQIMLESGGSYEGGLSKLASKFKNLFGMKGKGTAGSVSMQTTEYIDGEKKIIHQYFAQYNTFQESIEEHGKLLSKERYKKLTQHVSSVEEYAKAIHRAGYATDPNYADKLIKIINDNDLKKYDEWKPPINIDDIGIIEKDDHVTSDTGVDGSTAAIVGTYDPNKLDLKWWGDIVVIVFVLICVCLGVLFFIGAFQSEIPNPTDIIKKK